MRALEVLSALQSLRCIDLSHPLHPAIPYWPGAGYGPFRYEAINVFERDSKAAGVFEMPEHMGTHIDAPNHFVASPMSVDLLSIESLLRPAVVFDIADQAAVNAGALLEVLDIAIWEAHNGQVPPGSVALVRSGWAARWSDPSAFQNQMRFPAISARAARVLVHERGVVGIGVDTLSADNGLADNSPCHRLVHGHGAYILENLAHLELLPEHGAFVLIAPLPIQGGTGAPARVLAFRDGET
ncbi:MAG TPA: cyclase family protein [Chloroflexota bacterium]